jgi:DNA polymerase-3 subunit delta
VSIKPESLSRALQSRLEPVYLVAGAEYLLVQESRDLIIQAAQKQGFVERQVFQVDRSFDWSELGLASQEQSLFASRKIIDLRMPTGKPGREGGKFFVDYASHPDPDLLLIVSSGSWDGATRKSKWASELARAGELVEVWPVKPNELPGWIARRMQVAGLKADPEAVRLLAEFVEGNLLAAQQEIDKIQLLNSGSTVTVESIRSAVSSSARFDAFRLGECILNGQAADGLRVAAGLQRTGVAIQAVTGALYYTLSQWEGVRSAIANGEGEGRAFGRFRVFKMHQGPVRQVIRRIPASSLSAAFTSLSLIDRQSKGQEAGDPWQTLELLVRDLATAGNTRRVGKSRAMAGSR